MINETQQSEKDNKYSQRTQISLSPNIRNQIEKRRKISGESLSAYVRKAVSERVKLEETSNTEKMRAINDFVGAGEKTKNLNWSSDKKIIDWQRALRMDT